MTRTETLEPAASTRVDFAPAEQGGRMMMLLNSIVVPRPIAWVSTRSQAGVDNLAPHSYFTVASVEPSVVQFTSVGDKDTLRNVRETGEFVVNVVPYALAHAANISGTDYPELESEFDAAGLAREASLRVRPPRVAASPVALECVAVGERTFPGSTVVFGEVVNIAVRPEVLRDGQVAIDLLDPAARLGGWEWGRLGEIFNLAIVPYTELANTR
jgi:flavin reductase (DIM6/NTAB) family NADH-FMN oxidoreductase RutF